MTLWLAVVGTATLLMVTAAGSAPPVGDRPGASAPQLLWLAQAADADAEAPDDEADEPADAESVSEADEAASEEASDDLSGAEDGEEADEADEADDGASETTADDRPAVEESDEFAILRSPEQMPEPVRRTWQALVNAARSGNIEGLRLLIDAQPSPPVFSLSEIGDPIDYLKSLSGDAAGREVLAILLEILETGFVHVDRGTPQEMYLWPYFARYPLARLTPRETVEMFTILTAGDYQDMLSYGAYIFFRVGIGPDGTWHFFVAGD